MTWRKHKVPKIKKILPYELQLLVTNYSCLQNPRLGATAPRSPFSLSSVLNWICWTPPPTKFLGTPLEGTVAYLKPSPAPRPRGLQKHINTQICCGFWSEFRPSVRRHNSEISGSNLADNCRGSRLSRRGNGGLFGSGGQLRTYWTESLSVHKEVVLQLGSCEGVDSGSPYKSNIQ